MSGDQVHLHAPGAECWVGEDHQRRRAQIHARLAPRRGDRSRPGSTPCCIRRMPGLPVDPRADGWLFVGDAWAFLTAQSRCSGYSADACQEFPSIRDQDCMSRKFAAVCNTPCRWEQMRDLRGIESEPPRVAWNSVGLSQAGLARVSVMFATAARGIAVSVTRCAQCLLRPSCCHSQTPSICMHHAYTDHWVVAAPCGRSVLET